MAKQIAESVGAETCVQIKVDKGAKRHYLKTAVINDFDRYKFECTSKTNEIAKFKLEVFKYWSTIESELIDGTKMKRTEAQRWHVLYAGIDNKCNDWSHIFASETYTMIYGQRFGGEFMCGAEMEDDVVKNEIYRSTVNHDMQYIKLTGYCGKIQFRF